MRVWGIGFICVVIAMLASASHAASTTSPALNSSAAVISIDGEINDFTERNLEANLAAAKQAGAKTIILRLDTPGGAVVSALAMSNLIKRQGDVHVIAFVDTMALSAGSMLAVACDEIVMRPNSLIGDCAPILVGPGGLETLGAAERAKMESPILAEFYDSAERNGYDKLLVSAMVQYSVVVHAVDGPNGERRYVNDADYTKLLAQGWKPAAGIPDPLDGPNQLLTVNSNLAQKIGLSKGLFESPQSLAAARGLNIVATYNTTFGESLIALLGGPEVRGILGVIFMLSLYTSFSKPGTGIPEVIAVAAGVLMLGVPLLTGYASWFEILLILLGVLLVALEIFVIPGFGIPAVAGILLLVTGFVMTFAPPEPGNGTIIPQLQGTRHALAQGLVIVTSSMVIAAALWLWLSHYLHTIPYMNRLILNTSVGTFTEQDDFKDAVDQSWPAVGATGLAVTLLRPGGVARFFDPIENGDRNIDVISDHGLVENGRAIVVKAKEGKRVVVRAIDV